jgi:aquaporin Z
MNIKACTAEFIGTFALVFCGTGAIIINQESNGSIGHVGIAITFGLIVLAMIYSLGDISGAHLNPAVSLAFYFSKRLSAIHAFSLIPFQLSGAILASLVLAFLFPNNELLGSTLPAQSSEQSWILEFILSFFLMLVILRVSTGAKEKGITAAIAIGSTVGLEAMFAGPICGASMNPARSIAPALASGHFDYLWIYISAPIIGMIASVYIDKILEIQSWTYLFCVPEIAAEAK